MKIKFLLSMIWISFCLSLVGGCNPENNGQVDTSVKMPSEKNTTSKENKQKIAPLYPFQSKNNLAVLDISREDITNILANNGISEDKYLNVRDSNSLGPWKDQLIWLSEQETLTMMSKNSQDLSELFIIELNDSNGRNVKRNRQIIVDLIKKLDSKENRWANRIR